MTWRSNRSKQLVNTLELQNYQLLSKTLITLQILTYQIADKKAREEMAAKAKGKGPMNAGQQGIKKSGKK